MRLQSEGLLAPSPCRGNNRVDSGGVAASVEDGQLSLMGSCRGLPHENFLIFEFRIGRW